MGGTPACIDGPLALRAGASRKRIADVAIWSNARQGRKGAACRLRRPAPPTRRGSRRWRRGPARRGPARESRTPGRRPHRGPTCARARVVMFISERRLRSSLRRSVSRGIDEKPADRAAATPTTKRTAPIRGSGWRLEAPAQRSNLERAVLNCKNGNNPNGTVYRSQLDEICLFDHSKL